MYNEVTKSINFFQMKSEDGTGSRHAQVVLKRCGIANPPISFENLRVTSVTRFFYFQGKKNI